jgi:hypothetical protein
MNESHAIAAARTLAREVNKQIERVALRFESRDGDFLCECGRAECSERLRLGIAEYDAIRAAGRFVATPGHELASHDRVIERHENYVVGEAAV